MRARSGQEPVRLNAHTLAVLRPEPGNAATVARATAAGFATLALPLFEVQPLAWEPPDPAAHDALIVTSANTFRHGGPGLAALRRLPLLAVGAHTAQAARAAGFDVVAVGTGDAASVAALAAARGITAALHIGGRERTVSPGASIAAAIAVYASIARPIDASDLARLRGTVALLHSARAAQRLGTLVDAAGIERAALRIAAFSPAIAAEAGTGWAQVVSAARPDDAALHAEIERASLSCTGPSA